MFTLKDGWEMLIKNNPDVDDDMRDFLDGLMESDDDEERRKEKDKKCPIDSEESFPRKRG